MLLLLFSNQPPSSAASYVNLALTLNDLWPPLNANNAADAVFWTEAELYQWLDDALDRFSTSAPVFVVYDQSLVAVNGTGVYTQVTNPEFIATLQADLAGSVLRARNVQQLEALDDAWPTSSGTPEAFALDSAGLTQFLLYKVPGALDDGKLIGQVMQVDPLEVDSTHAILAAPTVMREYFTFYALGEARAKETRAQMPEIAQWFRGLVGLMDKAIVGYWGNA
jgi:hypothetical protein